MDKAHRWTDKKIEKLENDIDKLYSSKEDKLEQMFQAYFSQFEKEDAQKREELDDKEYKNWRIATMMSGRKWNAFVKSVVRVLVGTNEEAVDSINDSLQDVYIENFNFIVKDIERQVNEI